MKGHSGLQTRLNTDLEERLHFSVEPPPLPVPQLQVGGAVPLQDSDSVQLLDSLLVVPAEIRVNRPEI